jgi:hypothetical protein
MEEPGPSIPQPPPPPASVPLPPRPPQSVTLRPAGARVATPAPPIVSEAVLQIPLGTRELLRVSLDLLTRREAGLRGASFYVGFMLLVSLAPLMVIFGLLLTLPMVSEPVFADVYESGASSEAWLGWLMLASLPAGLGYVAAGTDARSLATAVIGGRVEGRPLRLRESISLARQRFWQILGAQLLIGVVTAVITTVVQLTVAFGLGLGDEPQFGVSLLMSVLVSVPFVYVPAGIVLGEVGMFDAIARSWQLVRLRRRLAVVVALFSVVGQFIVLIGLSNGIDIVSRVLIGTGVAEDFPRPLVVPIAAALVFALGTLTFLVEAIAAAPAVHAFAALTHYTRGLQDGRDRPVAGRSLFSPWLTPGMALVAIVAVLAMIGAVLTLPA